MDTKNAFNDINHIGMFWTVCHFWMYGALFVSNCYHQWSSLVMKNGNGTASFIHIRESVTEGYPFAMVVYGIGVTLMVKKPKVKFPDVTQRWYTDDSSAPSMFANIKLYVNSLKLFGPGCGYYPKPSKTILIVHQNNLKYGKRFGLRHEFKVFTAACYLGSLIRDDKSKRDCIKVCTSIW